MTVKTCPHCKSRATRRKKGCCPYCGEKVESIKVKNTTYWVPEGINSGVLVCRLEEHIRTQPGMCEFAFGGPWETHMQAQLALAKYLLLKCEWDQGLAEEVVDAYHAGDNKLIPARTMAGVVGKQFPVALAIAKHRINQRREEVEAAHRKSAAIDMKGLEVLYGI